MDTPARRLARLILCAIVLCGSVVAVWLGMAGQLRPLAAGVVCLLAMPSIRYLPGGTKAAAWLFAIWVGLTLALVARVDYIETVFAGDRARLAVAGGLSYLVLAGVAFWACGSLKKA